MGVERTWGGELNVNVQYLFKRVLNFRGLDSVVGPELTWAGQEELISNQVAETMQGASLRVDYKAFNETLELEVAAVLWFERRDSLLSPKLSYAFTDRMMGIVGANVFSGPTNSFFGQLRRTSAAFVEFRFGI